MADQPKPARNPFADIAPAVDDHTDNVLFGDVWKRPGPFHPNKALGNGVL